MTISKVSRDVCPICDSRELETLHRQDVLLPGDVRTHYAVVACERCGFLFARNLPSDEEYKRYYRANLKYTYEGSRDAADSLFAMHARSFDMVHAHLTHDRPPEQTLQSRIVDIGCSTGELLALFQRSGYGRLHGIDPTPECSQIARRLYGVDVETAVLSEVVPEEPYDVVLLANVLEHIPNLRDAVHRIARFVRDGGMLFVQIPDAGHFGADMQEPFLEFSIEHINYFTDATTIFCDRSASRAWTFAMTCCRTSACRIRSSRRFGRNPDVTRTRRHCEVTPLKFVGI